MARPGVGRRARRALSDTVPARIIQARRFKRIFGRRLDLRDPRTFNEKLHWLMLCYRPPLMSQLADKFAVRPYVAERVGPTSSTSSMASGIGSPISTSPASRTRSCSRSTGAGA